MALAIVLVVAVEAFSGVVHPLPPGHKDTFEEMCAHVARYPHWVLAVCVVLWSATAFASTWVAARVGHRIAGIAVILILSLAIGFNIAKLPYVTWFKVVMPICFAVACFLGCVRGVRSRSSAVDSKSTKPDDLREMA